MMKNKNGSNKHIFALHYPRIDQDARHSTCAITDAALIQRINKVLRVRSGDHVILFGSRIAATCRIAEQGKKYISIDVIDSWSIQPIMPPLYWYVPIADKAAFEDAVSYLTIMGAHTIYPIITEKSKQKWGTQKDFDRMHRVMIAAAEQSKQFALPEITHAYRLYDMPNVADYTFVCDPDGDSICAYTASITPDDIATSYAAIVGPEAGLTDHELAYLDRLGFKRLRLVSSVLRMETAVAVASGMIRSLLEPRSSAS